MQDKGIVVPKSQRRFIRWIDPADRLPVYRSCDPSCWHTRHSSTAKISRVAAALPPARRDAVVVVDDYRSKRKFPLSERGAGAELRTGIFLPGDNGPEARPKCRSSS